MSTRRFAVVLEPDEDGGFTVLVPSLPGVVTQGDTIEEALANARDAIELTLMDLEDLPPNTRGTQLFEVEVMTNRRS
jgi:predicted RNase H-like HicB family nuclease